MSAYAIHYNETTGDILSYTTLNYASTGDWIVTALPPNFTTNAYKIKLGTPLYFIQRETGYAYNSSATRVAGEDVDPEENDESSASEEESSSSSGSSSSSSGVVVGAGEHGKGYNLGDITVVDNGISIGDNVSSGSGEDEEEEDEEADPSTDESLMQSIAGSGIMVNIGFAPGETGWPQDSESGQYVRALESEYITPSTVLYVTGINRAALKAHLYWYAEDGRMVFYTATRPTDAILINGVLSETGDEWSAHGVIEAWPGAGIVSKRYRQALHATNWSRRLSACGVEGDSISIQTPLVFTEGSLLFATPEWTGNTHVIVPKIFINPETDKLCYVLTNCSPIAVTVTDVSLRLCYIGTISGLVEDSDDDATVVPYITEADIDELTS